SLMTYRRTIVLREVDLLCYEQSSGDFDSVIPLNNECIPVRIPYDVLDDWRVRRFIHEFFDVDPAVGVVRFYDDVEPVESHKFLLYFKDVCFLNCCDHCERWFVLPYTDYFFVSWFSMTCRYCTLKFYLCRECSELLGPRENLVPGCRDCFGNGSGIVAAFSQLGL
ncbi:MAG: hypothetical protein AB2695_21915, partial [Candidatus Thiodiazotropha endolucinida]